MELGALDTPDLTITTDWETARKIFVDQDQAAGMQAFMAGKIKVQGDMMKMMAMQTVDAAGRRRQADRRRRSRTSPPDRSVGRQPVSSRPAQCDRGVLCTKPAATQPTAATTAPTRKATWNGPRLSVLGASTLTVASTADAEHRTELGHQLLHRAGDAEVGLGDGVGHQRGQRR